MVLSSLPVNFKIFINKVRAVRSFSAVLQIMSDVIMPLVCSSKSSILSHYLLYFYRFFQESWWQDKTKREKICCVRYIYTTVWTQWCEDSIQHSAELLLSLFSATNPKSCLDLCIWRSSKNLFTASLPVK